MTRNVKNSVIKTLLTASIVPLFIFSFIFFGQTFRFFISRDRANIESVLQRERRYLQYLVDVNIKDMLVVSTSDNIRTQRVDEIMEVFERIMRVRDDFYKMKYVRPDGYTVEVVRGEKGVEYTKLPLGLVESTCLDMGEYGTYYDGGEEGQYVVFSAPFKLNGKIEAVILGYLPADKLNFITTDINLNAVGNIFIKDSWGKTLLKHGVDGEGEEEDIKYQIENTNWTMFANIDNTYFERLFYENILVRLIIFLILVVIFISPFSAYAANRLKDFVDDIIESARSLKKVEGRDSLYKLEELGELRKSYNKVIDIMNNNIKSDNVDAYVDKLTGLYNKMYIEDKLVTNIYERQGENIYFLMLDAGDHRSMSNNLVLDVGLAEIGELIRENIRFRDIAIRFSDEKFLIILRNIDHSGTVKIASRLKELAENKVASIEENELNLVVKIGISKYDGDVYKTISSSEKALHEARVSRDNKIKYRES